MEPKNQESAENPLDEIQELSDDELLESALYNLQEFINENYFNQAPLEELIEESELESDDLLEDDGLFSPET